jgi:hypothetical protein
VLDAALYEWEERMSADNVTVLVAEFDWSNMGDGEAHLDASVCSTASSVGRGPILPGAPAVPMAAAPLGTVATSSATVAPAEGGSGQVLEVKDFAILSQQQRQVPGKVQFAVVGTGNGI